MTTMRERTKAIRDFIFKNVSEHPGNISTVTAQEFNISRQAAHRHVARLVKEDLLETEGSSRKRQYTLKPTVDLTFRMKIGNLAEDVIWRERVLPHLKSLPANVYNICQYGFTEMVNNVIDHSEGSELTVSVQLTYDRVELVVSDDGVGIFNKIQRELGLDDPLHSLLELSKGKLTTDPKRHSGEGIFFSSRIFDYYKIMSSNIFFAHLDHGSKSSTNNLGKTDFLFELKDQYYPGTTIVMQISPYSKKEVVQVFNAYTADDSFDFSKTLVPVFLSAYGEENLFSRSQAKRLLARFDLFKEIILDFYMVESIGQAFADEVFRVFQQQNPGIRLYPMRANEQIEGMIKRILSRKDN